MPLIRPRLTDYYNLSISQSQCDFAIPLLDEDIPLYVDPFLLWKSPSLQDNALHTLMIASIDYLIGGYASGNKELALQTLSQLSECDEAGLGSSSSRKGRRIGHDLAQEIMVTLTGIPAVVTQGIRHLEVLQLLVSGIGKDIISDITCSLLKSFLIDYTIEQSRIHKIPTQTVTIPEVFDYQSTKIRREDVALPISPADGRAVLLIPKRWLRYSPWISYDSYFEGGFIKGDEAPKDRAAILLYNRFNFGQIQTFIAQREAAAHKCSNDPLFQPISVVSAKRRLASLHKLDPGSSNAHQYENITASLLTSVLHPHLDFASEQSRTESGAHIRDLIFYNTRTWDFLQDIYEIYESRQLIFELKNVKEVERDHINQLNRYMTDHFGRFGVLISRSKPPRRIIKNLVDLWAGQRRCIIILSDEDLDLMVTLFESRQRLPIEVLKKVYLDFTRLLPS